MDGITKKNTVYKVYESLKHNLDIHIHVHVYTYTTTGSFDCQKVSILIQAFPVSNAKQHMCVYMYVLHLAQTIIDHG